MVVQPDLREALKRAEAERDQSWADWQEMALSRACRAMHRYTKLATEWQPTTTRVRERVSSYPPDLVEAEVDTLRAFWDAEDEPAELYTPDRDHLDPSVSERDLPSGL